MYKLFAALHAHRLGRPGELCAARAPLPGHPHPGQLRPARRRRGRPALSFLTHSCSLALFISSNRSSTISKARSWSSTTAGRTAPSISPRRSRAPYSSSTCCAPTIYPWARPRDSTPLSSTNSSPCFAKLQLLCILLYIYHIC